MKYFTENQIKQIMRLRLDLKRTKHSIARQFNTTHDIIEEVIALKLLQYKQQRENKLRESPIVIEFK